MQTEQKHENTILDTAIKSAENECNTTMMLKSQGITYNNLILDDLDGEIWKPIINFEGLYEISNFGRVKSLERFVKFRNGRMFVPLKILKGGLRKGYHRVLLSDQNGVGKNYSVHILVAKAFISNPLNLPEVNHKNFIRNYNIVDNLEWSTQDDNLRHGWARRKRKTIKKKLSLDDYIGRILPPEMHSTNTDICNLDGEKWKIIKKYPEYKISNKGRVKSYKGIFEKILTGYVGKRGYHVVNLRHNNLDKTLSTHILVAKAFIKNKNRYYKIVNHINGCKLDNRVENLEWCNGEISSQHAFLLGLANGRKGIKHHAGKLTEEDVLNIRKIYKKGEFGYIKIAKLYGVCFQMIECIIKRKNWTHI